MKLSTILFLCVSSAIAGASASDNNTNNLRGGARALEDECAGQVGRAYGLCNAFCTAQDCDEAFYDDEGNIIKSCAKIKENYEDATGLASLPCEAAPVTCPCFGSSVLPPVGPPGTTNSLIGTVDVSLDFRIGAFTFLEATINGADSSCALQAATTNGITAEEAQACYDNIITVSTDSNGGTPLVIEAQP